MSKPKAVWESFDRARSEAKLAQAAVPPGAITHEQYASRYGLAIQTARGQLLKMEREGRVKSGRRLNGGKWVKYFWVPK